MSKKFLDSTGLSTYDGRIKEHIEDTLEDLIENLVDEQKKLEK